jgi:hypothetical protein
VVAANQCLLAIGVYPTIPLAQARQAREDAKRLLADGLDPALEKTPGSGPRGRSNISWYR